MPSNPAGQTLYDQWVLTDKSPPVMMVDGTIPLDPFADGDFDGDEAVDLDDYVRRSACETGPLDESQVIGCDVFDFDADNDVDLEDYGEFQLSFTG